MAFIGGLFHVRIILTAVYSAVVLCVSSATAVAGPCESGFELKLELQPVSGVDSEGIGVAIKYDSKKQLGTAERLETGAESSFGKAACEKWASQNWTKFERMITQSKQLGRKGMTCHNVGIVKYRVGSASKKLETICLGSARKDAVTHVFRRIFEGSDNLLSAR